jgi:hypothetical protein
VRPEGEVALRKGSDFGEGVLACVDDINGLIPELANRFHLMIIVSAFAQHVGGALQLLMRRKMCDAHDARLVLRRIERAAFRKTTH